MKSRQAILLAIFIVAASTAEDSFGRQSVEREDIPITPSAEEWSCTYRLGASGIEMTDEYAIQGDTLLGGTDDYSGRRETFTIIQKSSAIIVGVKFAAIGKGTQMHYVMFDPRGGAFKEGATFSNAGEESFEGTCRKK